MIYFVKNWDKIKGRARKKRHNNHIQNSRHITVMILRCFNFNLFLISFNIDEFILDKTSNFTFILCLTL